MAALVATIPAANVANALIQISTIENLVENGNQNLLTAAGNIVPITSNGFPVNAKTVVFNDTYFICEQPGQGFFAVSNSNDGSQWSPLAYAQAESTPDKLIAVDVLNGEIICFGTATIQFVTDQALPGQPYAQILGSTQQY